MNTKWIIKGPCLTDPLVVICSIIGDFIRWRSEIFNGNFWGFHFESFQVIFLLIYWAERGRLFFLKHFGDSLWSFFLFSDEKDSFWDSFSLVIDRVLEDFSRFWKDFGLFQFSDQLPVFEKENEARFWVKSKDVGRLSESFGTEKICFWVLERFFHLWRHSLMDSWPILALFGLDSATGTSLRILELWSWDSWEFLSNSLMDSWSIFVHFGLDSATGTSLRALKLLSRDYWVTVWWIHGQSLHFFLAWIGPLEHHRGSWNLYLSFLKVLARWTGWSGANLDGALSTNGV